MSSIKIEPSVLCDVCSNAGRGVRLPGKRICLSCAQDDAELVKQIVRLVMPEFSARFDEIVKRAGGIK